MSVTRRWRSMQRDECGIDRIARPPERGSFKLFAESRAGLPHADAREHLLTDRMLFRCT